MERRWERREVNAGTLNIGLRTLDAGRGMG
jgi:hypothetical protein